MEKILQIAGATDWSAVFAYRNEDSGEVELETWPLAVWALVEKADDTYITATSVSISVPRRVARIRTSLAFLPRGRT